jgi:hypothetical protein
MALNTIYYAYPTKALQPSQHVLLHEDTALLDGAVAGRLTHGLR